MHNTKWAELPAKGIEIALDGASAVISGLPVSDVHDFRVRALTRFGTSAWSDSLSMPIMVALEGELTAGQETDVFPVTSGYSVYGNLGGTLSPDRFVIEGTAYEVRFLAHASGSLRLGLDRELPSDFTLWVGDSVYRGSESMVPPAGGGAAAGYWWPSPHPDWLGDEPVRVRLVLHPGGRAGGPSEGPRNRGLPRPPHRV